MFFGLTSFSYFDCIVLPICGYRRQKLTTALEMNIKNGNFSHEKIRAHVEGELWAPSIMPNERLGQLFEFLPLWRGVTATNRLFRDYTTTSLIGSLTVIRRRRHKIDVDGNSHRFHSSWKFFSSSAVAAITICKKTKGSSWKLIKKAIEKYEKWWWCFAESEEWVDGDLLLMSIEGIHLRLLSL